MYDEKQLFWVNSIYIFSITMWFVIVWYFRLYTGKAAVFLWIPLVAFFISYSNTNYLNKEVEECMSKANYLSIGVILALHLLVWIGKDLKIDRDKFITVVMIAVLFTMITFIDIWVDPCYIPVFIHFQSSLQTMAISLLIYALATYLLDGGGRLLLETKT